MADRAPLRSPTVLRVLLVLLCAYCVTIGSLAAFAPRTFYDHFPFYAHWVDLLPPYNQHLVTDVGGLYLGFAVVFGWAAWRFERTLALAASVAFLLTAILHLIFHASHLHGLSTADAVGELTSLGLLLLLPLGVIWAAGDRAPARSPS